ncbi:MAG: hypothetical protein M3014_09230 [Chloroflexota bacterium]|nr:hypothetical protein [Chloroflexota bacterium]
MPSLALFSPTVIVFFGFGTAYALLFQLWKGQMLQHLLLFWLVSVLGFGLGYGAATLIPTHPLILGGIPVVEASLGSVVLLLVARRVSV